MVHLLQIARRYLKSFNDWPVKYYFWYVISKWIEFSCLYISHWHYSIRTCGYKVQMNLSIFCFERKVHLFLQECLFKIKTELCYFMFGLSAFLIKEQAELLTAFFVTEVWHTKVTTSGYCFTHFVTDSSLTYKGYSIWVLLYTFCHWFKSDIQRLQHLGTALHILSVIQVWHTKVTASGYCFTHLHNK